MQLLLCKRIRLVVSMRSENAFQDAILMIILRMILLIDRYWYSLWLRLIVRKIDSPEARHRSGESKGYLWCCGFWSDFLCRNYDVFLDETHILSIVVLWIVLIAYQTLAGDVCFWFLWDRCRNWHWFDLQGSRSFLLFRLDEGYQRSIFGVEVVVKRLRKR